MTAALRARLRRFIRSYPFDVVLLATMLVILIVVLGTFAQDALWSAFWNHLDRPIAAQFRGTCYWMADARILARIAGNGYTDYGVMLLYRHMTILPDRSWWPVYVNLTAIVTHLTGGYYCSNWIVNLMAMIGLPTVVQAITKTRRPFLLVGVAVLPFGSWLYGGITEGLFLLFSGILLWMSLHEASPHWRVNAAWGIAGLLMGIVVGLTKPNSIALLPGFGLLALTRTYTYLRNTAAASGQPFRLWRWANLRAALSDSNPGWTALLAMLGMLIGLGAWFYQTSGYYPLYILMAQRTLWYKEFDGGNVLALLSHLTRGWRTVLSGAGLPHPTPWNMQEFAVLTLTAILIVRDLPPRYPGSDPTRKPTPLYASISLITVFWLMFNTGQAHSIQRYYVGNIFFVVAFLRYVYGDEDEPPLAALPGIVRRREAGTLRAVLRLAMFGCGMGLFLLEAYIMAYHGT
jgi:hypothetical protein